jgi:hypothetical protein
VLERLGQQGWQPALFRYFGGLACARPEALSNRVAEVLDAARERQVDGVPVALALGAVAVNAATPAASGAARKAVEGLARDAVLGDDPRMGEMLQYLGLSEST